MSHFKRSQTKYVKKSYKTTNWLEYEAGLEAADRGGQTPSGMPRFFVFLVGVIVNAVRAICRSRADLVIQNLALRQQVTALKQQRPRPRLDDADRGFWVALRSCWPGWASCLVIVKPATVVKWHKERFRRYWTTLSNRNRRPGRPRVGVEIRRLIRTMALDNGWGAPRIHGELKKLGFVVSETTVSRYLPRRPPDPEQVQRWTTFLRNHADAIAAMDFFTVPTVSLRVLYYHASADSITATSGATLPDNGLLPRSLLSATGQHSVLHR